MTISFPTPVFKHRFRLIPKSHIGLSDDIMNSVSLSTRSIHIDFKNKEIKVEFNQYIDPNSLMAFECMATHKNEIIVDLLPSADNTEMIYGMVFSNTLCLEHEYSLDVSSSSVSIHKYVFKYEKFQVRYTPPNKKEDPIEIPKEKDFKTPQEIMKLLKKKKST